MSEPHVGVWRRWHKMIAVKKSKCVSGRWRRCQKGVRGSIKEIKTNVKCHVSTSEPHNDDLVVGIWALKGSGRRPIDGGWTMIVDPSSRHVLNNYNSSIKLDYCLIA